MSTPAQAAAWEQDMEKIIDDVRRRSSGERAEPEEKKTEPEVELPAAEVQEKAKMPSYTIMTKKIRPRKVAIKEQEAVFQEMIKANYTGKKDFMIQLPGRIGQFINQTLSETIRRKHPIDMEAEERRGELARQSEISVPSLPDFFEVEPPDNHSEELDELYVLPSLLIRRNVSVGQRPEVREEEKRRRESAEISGSLNMEDIDFQAEQPEQVLSQMDLKMMQYISERLTLLKEKGQEQIGFFSIVEGETKESKLKAFQELLSLEAKGVISMQQEEPFGDIMIIQKEQP